MAAKAAKATKTPTTYYLYNDQHQLSAELDAQGRITRQYLYLGDQPIAVIDSPQGKALSNQALSALDLIGLDAKTILNGWWRKLAGADAEQVTWLHPNHLGAPQAATDPDGQVVWRASYAPFGAAKVTAVSAGGGPDQARPAQAFTLNLRLPGQYFDAETGLHYNHHRYYDPSRGEYLTPDPLGYPDGPNPYAYVRYNPLKYIDPLGLILFAFDGTENTDDPAWLAANNSSPSNVVEFRDLYNDGRKRYITGVGTVDTSDPARPILAPTKYFALKDKGFNWSGPERIARMVEYAGQEAGEIDDTTAMDVDIIGFSRGAAQARDFSNQIVATSKKDQDGNYWYGYNDTNGQAQCQKVNFRFMGLWDTVLSTNNSRGYTLTIPTQFAHVAQAVALNEYRSSNLLNFAQRNPLPDKNHWGGFPLESITGSANPGNKTRIEMGFIGAHADIGGGYSSTDNQLSLVALSWMVKQAQTAGVTMKAAPAIDMNNPVLHDPSNTIRLGDPRISGQKNPVGSTTLPIAEDRTVHGACNPASSGATCRGGTITQRQMQFNNASMTNADTHSFINYTERDPNAANGSPQLAQTTGRVDMANYMAWLREHGYQFYGDN